MIALGLVTVGWLVSSRQETDVIIITFPSGTQIQAEVADTPEKLLFGLAFRDHLPRDTGMLYIFESSGRHRLRTTAFKFPVDMIWLDESRRIVALTGQAEPCPAEPCPLYGPPPADVRYVIQTTAGLVAQERLAPGMELKFTLRL